MAELRSFDCAVPPRGDGRENWHRERFCILALLAHLQQEEPGLFPAAITRMQAPDFLLCSEAAQLLIAIEHTDSGSHEYHCVLDEDAARSETGCVVVGARRGDCGEYEEFGGWVGDGPEHLWLQDICDAVRRKSAQKYWRNAPPKARRWLLVYDNSETALFIEDAAATEMTSTALSIQEATEANIQLIALVRGDAIMIVRRAAAQP